MKRIGMLALLLVLSFSFDLADEPNIGFSGEGDVEDLEGAIDTHVPIDESGEVNFSGYEPFRSKAEERIEAVNVYLGPITRALWGFELELSWTFVFAFVMWILIIEIILVPVSEIFDWNFWATLVFSGIVSTLVMQSYGKDFVIWVDSIIGVWWVGFIVLVGAVIFWVVYLAVFKSVGAAAKRAKKKAKEERTERDRKILHVEAKLAHDSIRGK